MTAKRRGKGHLLVDLQLEVMDQCLGVNEEPRQVTVLATGCLEHQGHAMVCERFETDMRARRASERDAENQKQ